MRALISKHLAGSAAAVFIAAAAACVGDDPEVSATKTEADAGESSVEDSSPSTDAGADTSPVPEEAGSPSYIFVSMDNYDGEQVGGTNGADEKCALEAKGAGLPGIYKAWISDDTIKWTERIRGNGPWRRMDGTVVFAAFASLTGAPLTSVDTTILDTSPKGTSSFWSGAPLPDGTAAQTCEHWTSRSNSSRGTKGRYSQATKEWAAEDFQPCNESLHLVCLRAD